MLPLISLSGPEVPGDNVSLGHGCMSMNTLLSSHSGYNSAYNSVSGNAFEGATKDLYWSDGESEPKFNTLTDTIISGYLCCRRIESEQCRHNDEAIQCCLFSPRYLAELQALTRLTTSPPTCPPMISPKSKSRPMSTVTDDTPTSATEAARRAWANNLKNEWERCGTHQEEHSLDQPAGPAPAGFRTSYPQPNSSLLYSYSAVSSSLKQEHCCYVRAATRIDRDDQHWGPGGRVLG